MKINVPADVPKKVEQDYIDNYNAITKQTDRLLLFACDQKIEHLNKDFYGAGIHQDALNPEHIFAIASQGTVGALATQLGLIARYGNNYPKVNYIVKLNGKTDLVPTQQKDPLSAQLWTARHAIQLKEMSGLPIRGIGYTLYLGSEYEPTMLTQAAHAVYEAHHHGLVAILWIYLRGKSVTDETNAELLAGAAGIAATLGADFVKIKSPQKMDDLRVACSAAGNTKLICAGGKAVDPEQFLQTVREQLQTGGTAGCAVGRNIFQKSLPDAVAFTEKLAAIVYSNK